MCIRVFVRVRVCFVCVCVCELVCLLGFVCEIAPLCVCVLVCLVVWRV